MKKRCCSKCGNKYPATIKYFSPNKGVKSGLNSSCKKCKNEYIIKYYQTKKGKIARENARLKSTYGLTIEQRKKLYLKQNGCCKICNMAIPYDKILTDHNHKTNKVRGLLCHNCNTGIGLLKDDIKIMRSAIFYLKK